MIYLFGLHETTVNNFNSSFTDGIELFKLIDLGALYSNVNQQVNRVMAYIVDMTKVEALDCLGDLQAGVELVEQCL